MLQLYSRRQAATRLLLPGQLSTKKSKENRLRS